MGELGVEHFLFLSAAHTFNDHGTVSATIDGELAQWLLKSTTQDAHASCSIAC